MADVAELRLNRPSRWSVRARTTAVSTAVVALTLLIGMVGLVVVIRGQLTAGAEQSASARAEDIEGLLAGGAPLESIAIGDEDDVVVQVLDAAGAVVLSSGNINGEAPLAPRPGVRDVPVGEHPFVLITEDVDTSEGSFTVIAGQSLERMHETTSLLVTTLGGGLPVVLLVVFATLWRMTGAAIRPVERIRLRVDQVQAADPSQRVPVPDADDEIARLATTMNTMLERVEVFQRHQRQFVSDASHELRSPIAIVRQLTEVAIAHPERNDDQLIGDIHAETVRMQAVVEDLLLLARGRSTALADSGRAVDLDDLALAELQRLRASTSLTVDGTGVGPARTVGSELRLARAVRNLVDNAVNHANVSVAISTSTQGRTAAITVDDDGPGIPEADRQRVFDRFVRLDHARSRDKGGSGLGLAIVADIVAAHNGTVEAVDSPLGGARITIHLPAPDERS